jgi:hypothetical protein
VQHPHQQLLRQLVLAKAQIATLHHQHLQVLLHPLLQPVMTSQPMALVLLPALQRVLGQGLM